MITSPSAPVMANSQDQAEVTKLSDDLVSQINNTSTSTIFKPLSGVQNGDSIYTLPLGLAWYKCYIPSAYLVSTDSSGHALTIRTSANGSKVVKVPLAPSGDTILSGNLFFDVLIDDAGNVTAGAFEISASNAYGNYTKKPTGTGTGILVCWYTTPTQTSTGRCEFVCPAVFSSQPVVSGCAIPWAFDESPMFYGDTIKWAVHITTIGNAYCLCSIGFYTE
jgi:hypothetical protein